MNSAECEVADSYCYLCQSDEKLHESRLCPHLQCHRCYDSGHAAFDCLSMNLSDISSNSFNSLPSSSPSSSSLVPKRLESDLEEGELVDGEPTFERHSTRHERKKKKKKRKRKRERSMDDNYRDNRRRYDVSKTRIIPPPPKIGRQIEDYDSNGRYQRNYHYFSNVLLIQFRGSKDSAQRFIKDLSNDRFKIDVKPVSIERKRNGNKPLEGFKFTFPDVSRAFEFYEKTKDSEKEILSVEFQTTTACVTSPPPDYAIKFWICVLTFVNEDQIVLVYDNLGRNIQTRNFISDFKSILSTKIKRFDSRNSFDESLIVLSDRDLKPFYSWLKTQPTQERVFAEIVDRVGLIMSSSSSSNLSSPKIASVHLTNLRESFTSSGNFETFVRKHTRHRIDDLLHIFRGTTPSPALCSLSFKFDTENRPFRILEIGMHLSTRDGKDMIKSFSVDRGDFITKLDDETGTFRYLFREIETFLNANGIREVDFLFHSNFIVLPTLFETLERSRTLFWFYKLSRGVVDLASLVDGNDEINEEPNIAIPSLDTIFMKMDIQSSAWDSIDLTASAITRCFRKLTEKKDSNFDLKGVLREPRIPETSHFQKVVLPEDISLIPGEEKTVEFNIIDLKTPVMFVSSNAKDEKGHVIVDKFYYKPIGKTPIVIIHLKNRLEVTLSLTKDHQIGFFIADPRSVLCPSRLDFVRTSTMPMCKALKLSALRESVPPTDLFLHNSPGSRNNSTVYPNLILENDDYRLYFVSIMTKGGVVVRVSVSKTNGEVKTVEKDEDIQNLLGNPSHPVVIVAYNVSKILDSLRSIQCNIRGVCELRWLLNGDYDLDWTDLISLNLGRTIETNNDTEEVVRLSVEAARTKFPTAIPFDFRNIVRQSCVEAADFLKVQPMKLEWIEAFLDIKLHHPSKEDKASVKCVDIRIPRLDNKSITIPDILPPNRSLQELEELGYLFQDGRWTRNIDGIEVVKVDEAVTRIFDFFSELEFPVALIIISEFMKHVFATFLLSSSVSSRFQVVMGTRIMGSIVVIPCLFSQLRGSPYIIPDMRRFENQSVRDLYDRIESSFKRLSPFAEPLSKQLSYVTFFVSIKTMSLKRHRLKTLNSETIGMIGCHTTHNAFGTLLPITPHEYHDPESATKLGFHRTSPSSSTFTANNNNNNGLYRFKCFGKLKSCYPESYSIQYLLGIMEDEIKKTKSYDGALLIGLTDRDIPHLLAACENAGLTQRLLKSVRGVGDIMSYLRNELKMERISTLEDLNYFYRRNVIEGVAGIGDQSFATCDAQLLSLFGSQIARYLVKDDFVRLSHSPDSWYVYESLIKSQLLEFRESTCEILSAKDDVLFAKSKKKLDAVLPPHFHYENYVDERMIVGSVSKACGIRVPQEAIIFFKNHWSLLSVENVTKSSIYIKKGMVIGRAVMSKFIPRPDTSSSNKKSKYQNGEDDEQIDLQIFKNGGNISNSAENIADVPEKQTTRKQAKEKSCADPGSNNDEPKTTMTATTELKTTATATELKTTTNVSETTAVSIDPATTSEPKATTNEARITAITPADPKSITSTDTITPEATITTESDTIITSTTCSNAQLDTNDNTVASTDPVKVALESVHVLNLDPSFKPYAETILKDWKLKDEPLNSEAIDDVICKMMGVGLKLNVLEEWIEEQKPETRDDLSRLIFSKSVALSLILDADTDFFIDSIWTHYGLASSDFNTNQNSQEQTR